jgi:hypothetical protein
VCEFAAATGAGRVLFDDGRDVSFGPATFVASGLRRSGSASGSGWRRPTATDSGPDSDPDSVITPVTLMTLTA